MPFIQEGNIVTADYYPINPELIITGSLNGTISEDGKELTGTWTDTGGIAFIMSDDASSFSGSWGYDDLIETYVGNNTDRWSGTWDSGNFSFTLEQDGSLVSGTLITLIPESGEAGKIEGVVSEDGKELTGTWTESGGITLILGEDGSFFNGTYSYGSVELTLNKPGSGIKPFFLYILMNRVNHEPRFGRDLVHTDEHFVYLYHFMYH